jgi:predicted Holliday junction resolvase-like endonuclease
VRTKLSDAVLIIIAALLIVAWLLFKWASSAQKEAGEVKFSKASQSVKYGKWVEQWAPFMKGYKYDVSNSRFLGSPIDLIQFEPDEIVFIDVKCGGSKLSEREENIKKLVSEGKVRFETFRIGE